MVSEERRLLRHHGRAFDETVGFPLERTSSADLGRDRRSEEKSRAGQGHFRRCEPHGQIHGGRHGAGSGRDRQGRRAGSGRGTRGNSRVCRDGTRGRRSVSHACGCMVQAETDETEPRVHRPRRQRDGAERSASGRRKLPCRDSQFCGAARHALRLYPHPRKMYFHERQLRAVRGHQRTSVFPHHRPGFGHAGGKYAVRDRRDEARCRRRCAVHGDLRERQGFCRADEA